MSTSKPRKSRKRSREIRERAQMYGAQYTAALRANDRARPAAPPPAEPWTEPSVATVRKVAEFVRQRNEHTAGMLERDRARSVLRQVLPALEQDDLGVRFFRYLVSMTTTVENLLVDALAPEESPYGDLDDEDRCTPEEVREYWRSLLDLAHQHRDHPDLPFEVRDTLARWTPGA
ncbi:hypothetical protein [Streptomyces goshikiensis]|uniref:hypothetical protein n=1 Tax=Streptomyces goshikiensis TaxID=1942 RepID=UPI00369098D2